MKDQSSITFGTVVAGLLFFGGVGAGPGYWIYSKTHSGQPMAPHEIRQAGTGFRSVTVALSPDMNPIGMAISANYSYTWAHDKPAYLAVALNDGRTRLAQGTATFETDKEHEKPTQTGVRITIGGHRSSKTVFLESFTVPRADNYTFQFTSARPDSSTVRINDAHLELRRNMKPANMKIVWAGVGVLVFSLLFGWMVMPAKVEN